MGLGAWIMVVDDEPLICTTLASALSRRGYRAEAFIDPLVAIATFERSPDDLGLLITDLAMPATSGLDVIRAVRARRPVVPVVLVSSHLTPTWEAEAKQLSVTRTVTKPAPIAKMRSLVEELLGHAA